MAEHINVTGFCDFMAKVTELEKAGKEVYCLFSGSKDEAGNSWCPDCVTAEPVVMDSLKNMPKSAVFIHCSVGERDYWKNKTNEFRVNPKLKLTGVPTFMKWGEPNKKLAEAQLSKPNLINMAFEEDD